jgi:hypothetical protein
MENRERDRMSQRDTPTGAGHVNRNTEEMKGREQNSGTNAGFGQKIGQAEKLEDKSGSRTGNSEGRH